MKRLTSILIPLLLPLGVAAQGENSSQQGDSNSEIEEIIISGERPVSQLRQEMWSAEAEAYEVFNKYNDERRFKILCNMEESTYNRLERQVCKPNFEREAESEHGQHFLETLRTFLAPYANPGALPTDGSSSPAISMQAVIAS